MDATLFSCTKGDIFPLSRLLGSLANSPAASLPQLPVGTILSHNEKPLFRVVDSTLVFLESTKQHYVPSPLIEALETIKESRNFSLSPHKEGFSLAWITLSDKGWNGQREDQSGPVIPEIVTEASLPLCWTRGFLLPDNAPPLRALVTKLALSDGYDLIITTGGTGLSPRDITAETIQKLFDYSLPGFSQAMMMESLKVTVHAALSRACAGVIHKSIVICLPGSLRAVKENLSVVAPALKHAIEKLQGDSSDCGLFSKKDKQSS